MQTANPRRGYILGLSAYVIWGLFPLYFKLLASVPAAEIIVNRVLWSALFGSLMLLVWKHPGWWQELRDNPKRLGVLTISGLLIAANWLTYVWAVNNDRMVEASLGYYINPLVNVLPGMLLFIGVVVSWWRAVRPQQRTLVLSADNAIWFGTTVGILAALVSGLFDHYFSFTQVLIALFWLMLGLSLHEAKRLKHNASTPLSGVRP